MKKIVGLIAFVVFCAAMFAIADNNNHGVNYGCHLQHNSAKDDSAKIEADQVAKPAPAPQETTEIVAERNLDEYQIETDESHDDNVLELAQELTRAHEEIESLKKENDFLKHELTKLHKKSLVDHQAWNYLQDPEGKMDLDHLQEMAMNLFETLPEINPHDLSPSQLNNLIVGFAKLRNCEELAKSAFCGLSSEKFEENQQGIRDILKREKEEDERFRNCLASQFGNEVATNWSH